MLLNSEYLMINRLPSAQEVRKLIEAIDEGLNVKHPRIRKNIDPVQIQMALKYQFLIAGHSSEVAGKYRLDNTPLPNAYKTKIGPERAVIFIKKGRWKKSKNIFVRGSCIPLKHEYEPWAQEVYEYVTENEQPFSFHKNDATSKRIYEQSVTEIFQSLKWNNEIYEKEDILKYRIGKKRGWINFATECLYKVRLLDLKYSYNFDEAKLIAFNDLLPDHKIMDYNDTNRLFKRLEEIGDSYFHRLCTPFNRISRVI